MNAPVAAAALVEPKRITTTLHPDEFPPIYAMIADGTCMEPQIPDGTKLVFLRDAVYRPGDLVILHRRPELVRPGEHQMIIKRLVIAPPQAYWRPGWVNNPGLKPVVIVDMINPARRLFFDPSHLLGIHKCRGPAVPEEVGDLIGDEEVRQRYPRA